MQLNIKQNKCIITIKLKMKGEKNLKKTQINNMNQGQSYESLIKRISSPSLISQH